MNPRPPCDKVAVIKRSLRCFACGLTGLLPGIGLPFAVVALVDCLFVVREGDDWNPAARYLQVGALAGMTGLLLSMLLASILVLELS